MSAPARCIDICCLVLQRGVDPERAGGGQWVERVTLRKGWPLPQHQQLRLPLRPLRADSLLPPASHHPAPCCHATPCHSTPCSGCHADHKHSFHRHSQRHTLLARALKVGMGVAAVAALQQKGWGRVMRTAVNTAWHGGAVSSRGRAGDRTPKLSNARGLQQRQQQQHEQQG